MQCRCSGQLVAAPFIAVRTVRMDQFVEAIKQHPGQKQVDRAVVVAAPGKHFAWLSETDKKKFYDGVATEYRERYQFERHKAWGAAHKGPGIRFVCKADALDDPDHKGFWVPLGLWNRWRHETYKDNREAELPFLDALPAAAPAALASAAAAPKEAKEPGGCGSVSVS